MIDPWMAPIPPPIRIASAIAMRPGKLWFDPATWNYATATLAMPLT